MRPHLYFVTPAAVHNPSPVRTLEGSDSMSLQHAGRPYRPLSHLFPDRTKRRIYSYKMPKHCPRFVHTRIDNVRPTVAKDDCPWPQPDTPFHMLNPRINNTDMQSSGGFLDTLHHNLLAFARGPFYHSHWLFLLGRASWRPVASPKALGHRIFKDLAGSLFSIFELGNDSPIDGRDITS